jgi:OmpA-OmpF porin, OOP family
LRQKHTKFLILTKSNTSIMAINLLDLVQGQLGGAAMSQIGKFLGEDSSKASAGMAAALPAILGSVMQKGSTESGAKGIMDLLSSGGHDGSMFDNLGALLSGGNSTNNLMNSGGTLLQFFMGDKTTAITDLLIRSTGLGKGTMGSILRIAAPMLVGMIGKQVSKSGLNAGGLMSMLSGQKDFVKAALPAGMGSLLGFSDMDNEVKETVSRAANTAHATTTNATKEGKSMLSRALPLVLIAALAFAGYKYFTGGNNAITDAAETAMDKTADAANAVGDAAGDAASVVAATAENAANATADAASSAGNAVRDAARKALADVKFAAGSAGENMYKLLDSGDAAVGKSVVFKTLTFKTGSAEIDPATAIEIEHLAQVLKAYPNVKVEIGGHTDNVGDAAKNLKLSETRAVTVAKMLVRTGGIDQSRVSAFGFGDGKPVGDNKTEAGRAMNRRIDVTIVE